MSDSYHMITVVLDEAVSEDRAKEICQAIKQLRDVLTAEPAVRDGVAFSAQFSAHHAMRGKLIEALRGAKLI